MKRIGFLADTHSRKPDGSDLPAEVLAAFKGVDLIVHLGDIGRKGILERLGTVAPVLVPSDDRKGYVRADGSGGGPLKVLETAGKARVGLCFNLTLPDKKIAVGDDAVHFPEGAIDRLLQRRFKQPVDVVAFGGTHRQHEQVHEGVLFFNPGSPTLPSDKRGDNDLGSVAVLDVAGKKPKVKLVRLTRR